MHLLHPFDRARRRTPATSVATTADADDRAALLTSVVAANVGGMDGVDARQWVLHVDLDMFLAAVEVLRHPDDLVSHQADGARGALLCNDDLLGQLAHGRLDRVQGRVVCGRGRGFC